jgi:hypothetical protein
MPRTHFKHPRFAIFAIEEGDDCQHDRTPLFISGTNTVRVLFPACVAKRKNDFLQPKKWFRRTAAMKSVHGFASKRAAEPGSDRG